MYVCICSAVTDREIRHAVEEGATCLTDIQSRLPVGMCCGRCEDTARHVVDDHLRKRACAADS